MISLLAWILGPICTIKALLYIYGQLTTSEFELILAQAHGSLITFPWGRWALGALVCWAWLLSGGRL